MSVLRPPLEKRPGAGAPARGREQTRQRLAAAGTALFAAHGLHGVTSAQIARRAGVATGTFYLHYADKGTLFREIVFDALARLRERQDRAALGAAAGSGAELRARTAELLAFAEENRDLIRVLFGRGAESAEVGEEVFEHIVRGIEQRLAARRAAGDLPAELHPPAAAQAIAAMTLRVIVWWIDHPERATREQVIDTLLRMHPTGVGRRRQS